MFTLDDIHVAHAKVRSGADFQNYAKEISAMGVIAYDTFVSDGHTIYFGKDESLTSPPKYKSLEVMGTPDKEKFVLRLKLHQSGGTDYMTFCRDCAENGIEKWTLDMEARTCTYSDKNGGEVLVEYFGSQS